MAQETKITLPVIAFIVGIALTAIGWGYSSSQRITILEVKADSAATEISRHERLEERVRILENTITRQTETLDNIKSSVERIEREVRRAR